MKSKKDLLEYVIKMRQRGDSWSAVLGYLKRNCDNEELVKEVFREVDKLDRENNWSSRKNEKNKIPLRSVIFGLFFLLTGFALFGFLWGKGWISIVPIFMIGIGILGITGAIK